MNKDVFSTKNVFTRYQQKRGTYELYGSLTVELRMLLFQHPNIRSSPNFAENLSSSTSIILHFKWWGRTRLGTMAGEEKLKREEWLRTQRSLFLAFVSPPPRASRRSKACCCLISSWILVWFLLLFRTFLALTLTLVQHLSRKAGRHYQAVRHMKSKASSEFARLYPYVRALPVLVLLDLKMLLSYFMHRSRYCSLANYLLNIEVRTRTQGM